jgi:hypothetical protein
MKTSKYAEDTRRNTKLDQRTDAYRDLQRRTAEARVQLETKLRERNKVIERLKKKLVETGVSTDGVDKLAA